MFRRIFCSLILFGSTVIYAGVSGTAFFIDSIGHLATAGHVSEDATTFFIEYKGHFEPVHLMGKDSNYDIAIFSSNLIDTPYLILNSNFENKSDIKLLGYPIPQIKGYNLKTTYGTAIHSGMFSSYVETTVLSCPGNSGSPIMLFTNQVIGLYTDGYNYSIVDQYQCTTEGFGTSSYYLIQLANKLKLTLPKLESNSSINNAVVLIEGW